MKYKKLEPLLITFIVICTIFIGFKSVAFLIKNNDTKKEAKSINNVIKPVSPTIENEELYYKVPKDALILVANSSLNYKVIENTLILDKPNGNRLRVLHKGEILTLDKLDGRYGVFNTLDDDISGYVNLGDLALSKEEPISHGISKVDKSIKNDDSYYVLAEGETVAIKSHDKGKFTIIDNNNLEFSVDDADIEIRTSSEPVSRSLISGRTQSLTKLISSAYGLIGTPYIYGDTGKRGFDCSGFTYSLYLNQLDIKIPRSSVEQVNFGSKVAKSDLAPGDLLFFNTVGRRISHVGIYIGEGNMIHASSGKSQVRIDSINTGYYNQKFVTARRIVK